MLHLAAPHRTMLYHTAPCCTLHHDGPHCTTLPVSIFTHTRTFRLHYAAVNCTTLHHAVTHCNTLHRTASHCTVLHHTALHCTILHHTVGEFHYCTHTHTPTCVRHTYTCTCDIAMQKRFVTNSNTLQRTASHCITCLQQGHTRFRNAAAVRDS